MTASIVASSMLPSHCCNTLEFCADIFVRMEKHQKQMSPSVALCLYRLYRTGLQVFETIAEKASGSLSVCFTVRISSMSCNPALCKSLEEGSDEAFALIDLPTSVNSVVVSPLESVYEAKQRPFMSSPLAVTMERSS